MKKATKPKTYVITAEQLANMAIDNKKSISLLTIELQVIEEMFLDTETKKEDFKQRYQEKLNSILKK